MKRKTGNILALIICLSMAVSLASCGDGDDEGEGGNTNFFGTYSVSLTISDCETREETLTIGNDENSVDNSEYLYVPAVGEEYSYSATDADDNPFARSITITGTRIDVSEAGQFQDDPSSDWSSTIEYDFENDYDSATITGTVSYDDSSICDGDITGTLARTQ